MATIHYTPLCRQEARAVIFGCIDDLIQKTGLNMRKVDFLVINCSLFSPTPSLCAMVATHYKVCVYQAQTAARSIAMLEFMKAYPLITICRPSVCLHSNLSSRHAPCYYQYYQSQLPSSCDRS
jgi:3-ketoacyl-CoA synthase